MAPSKFLDLHGALHTQGGHKMYKHNKYKLHMVYYTRGTQDVQAQQAQATYGVLEKGDTRGDLAKLVGKWWRGRGGEPTHL